MSAIESNPVCNSAAHAVACADLFVVFGSVMVLVPLYLVESRINYPSAGATGPPVESQTQTETLDSAENWTLVRPYVLDSPNEPERGGRLERRVTAGKDRHFNTTNDEAHRSRGEAR